MKHPKSRMDAEEGVLRDALQDAIQDGIIGIIEPIKQRYRDLPNRNAMVFSDVKYREYLGFMNEFIPKSIRPSEPHVNVGSPFNVLNSFHRSIIRSYISKKGPFYKTIVDIQHVGETILKKLYKRQQYGISPAAREFVYERAAGELKKLYDAIFISISRIRREAAARHEPITSIDILIDQLNYEMKDIAHQILNEMKDISASIEHIPLPKKKSCTIMGGKRKSGRRKTRRYRFPSHN